MTSTTKVTKSFTLPKLRTDGSNWILFQDSVELECASHSLKNHIDGTGTEPVNPHPSVPGQAALTAAQQTAVDEFEKKLEKWVSGEATIRKGLSEALSPALYLTVRKESTAKKVWDAVVKHHHQKSQLIIVELRRKLQNERCEEKGDMRAHLAKLRQMRDDLASMGEVLPDDGFRAIILGSLPASYDTFLTAVSNQLSPMPYPMRLAEMTVQGVTIPAHEITITPPKISPDDLMEVVGQEADRRTIKSGSSKKDEKDVAFSANASSKGGKKAGGKSNIECYNCHKKGHIKPDCWAKGGGKEGQGPKGKGKSQPKKEQAAAATDSDDAAWMASDCGSADTILNDCADIFDGLFEDEAKITDDDLPGLCTSSDSSSDDDDIPELVTCSDSESDDSDDDDDNSPYEWIRNRARGLLVEDDEGEAHTQYESALLAHDCEHTPIETELYDSGASRHMSPYRNKFINFVSIIPKPITAANKLAFDATGRGDMEIEVPLGNGKSSKVLLKDVLYAQEMGVTLVSISRITAAGHKAVFDGPSLKLFNRSKKLLGEVPINNGLYRVEHNESAHAATETLTVDDLHRQMGHIAPDAAKLLVKKGIVEGIELDESQNPRTCDVCEFAKTSRKAIKRERVTERAKSFGDEVHSDLWGPAPVRTKGWHEYYISFTDDHTRFTHLYLQKTKDEAFESYKKYRAWAKTQWNTTEIKTLRTDRGGEFLSGEFDSFLDKKGTIRKLTVHDTPEYNGVAERLNRMLLEKVRAMLHTSGLPRNLWGEAVMHAVYLKNRTSTRALENETPYEMLTGKKPNLANLHEFGTKVWVHDDSGSKLDGRSRIGRWVGFDEISNGHRVYWPDKLTVSVERSVKFDDNWVTVPRTVTLEGEPAGNKPDDSAPLEKPIPDPKPLAPVQPAQDHLGADFEPAPKPPMPQQTRSQRIRKESDYVKRLRTGEGSTGGTKIIPKGLQVVKETGGVERAQREEGDDEAGGETGEKGDREETAASVEEWEIVDVDWEGAMSAVMAEAEAIEPTFEEAKRRADWPKWEEAIKVELATLKAAGTWTVVKRPENTNVVDSKWVFRIKKNSAGEIDKYKARLVARGFTQIHGVDYYETFAPVAKLASVRTILAIAARNDWEIDVFDFHGAYLNGELNEREDVYMEQPPDYETADRRTFVLKLKKALYGLKQGGRKWYDTLCRTLAELGMKRSEADFGVFYAHTVTDIILLAIHVDDCMLTGNNVAVLTEFKRKIGAIYKLTDLGPISWLLGIKVTRDRELRTLHLSQTSYIESIIRRFNFDDLKPASIPIDPTMQFSKKQCPQTITDIARMKNIPYREAIGSLMYAAIGTHPDIAFSVSTLAQFSDNPGQVHWDAVKHVFRYLNGTKELALGYGGEGKGKGRGLEGFSDADGTSQEHQHAITGFAFLIDGGAVSWSSKKQELVTLSTTEAEYVASSHASREALWLRRLIGEVFRPLQQPTPLYCDNQSAIALAQNDNYHARTKHIDIRYHFIRYVIEEGHIKLIYCPTDEMTADTLTKALHSIKAKHFASALGLSF